MYPSSGIIYVPHRQNTALVDIDDNLLDTEATAEKMGFGDDYRDTREEPEPSRIVSLHSRVLEGRDVETVREIVRRTPAREGAGKLVNALHANDYEVWAVTNNPAAALAEDYLQSRFGIDGFIYSHEPVVKKEEVTGELRYNGPKEDQARAVVKSGSARDVQVVTDPFDVRFREAMEDEGAEVHVIDEDESLTDIARRFWTDYVTQIV